jgi:hypothetical protein
MKTRYGLWPLVAGAVLVALALWALSALPSAEAQDLTLSAPQDVRRGSGIVALDEISVPSELDGRLCTAAVTSTNNSSIHPGNDLILTSTTSTEFSEVEAVADEIHDDTGTLVLGSTVRLELRFGPNGVSSAGWVVTIDCPPDATTTTTSVPGSSTTTTLPETPPETSIPVTVPDYTG